MRPRKHRVGAKRERKQRKMIFIVRKSLRRTGRVVFEKTFMAADFISAYHAKKAAFSIALAEDGAKKDTEVIELLEVSGITQF